jgi:hypothetical protein
MTSKQGTMGAPRYKLRKLVRIIVQGLSQQQPWSLLGDNNRSCSGNECRLHSPLTRGSSSLLVLLQVRI